MGSRFFKPFVGENYEKGINGKKVLVLGASFYCNEVSCKYFEECTSVDKKDSSSFDAKCSLVDYNLSDEPLNEMESICGEGTYKKFANEMMKFTGTSTSKDTWGCFAFTNYVQFFLPGEEGKFRPTLRSDLSERDYEAFNETLRELKPDIVIVWGTVFSSRIMRDNEYLVDENELEVSEGYLCHIKLPDMEKQITLVNPYHPSSSAWYSNIEKFEDYFTQSLETISGDAISAIRDFVEAHSEEYKKLAVSLYATMPNAKEELLQALEEYRIDLTTELTQKEMDALQKDYKAVVRFCYENDRAGAKDSRPTHWLPRTLIDLCVSIMKPKSGSEILLPYAGDAQIAHALPKCSFDGYEPDSKIWAYSQIVCDAFSANAKIQLGNFKDSIDEKTYDYVFSCPLGRDLRTIVDDDMARNRLKTNGVMCCVLPISFCDPAASDWMDWYDLRRVLSEKHPTYKAEIISLPGLQWTRDGENVCVLFLTKNGWNDITDSEVVLMNANSKDFYNWNRERVGSGEYSLNVQSILCALKDRDKKYVWHGHPSALKRIRISKEEEDFSLLPDQYIVEQYLPASSKNEKRVKLGEILEVVSPQPEYDFEARFLSGQDLYDDPLNCDVFYKDLHHGGIPGEKRIVTENCLFFSYINGRFKVGRAKDFSNENPVELGAGVIPVKFKSSLISDISEDFVLTSIMSENSMRQAEAVATWDGFTQFLRDEDLFKIEILIPSKEKQEQETRQRLVDADRKLLEAIEGFREDTRIKKHALGQTVYALKNWWRFLEHVRCENDGVLDDNFAVGDENDSITVREISAEIKNAIDRLQKQIYSFDRGGYMEMSDFSLSEFLEKYVESKKKMNFKFKYKAEWIFSNPNTSEFNCNFSEKKERLIVPVGQVRFPQEALTIILDDIIDNACWFGFTADGTENIIRIDLESVGLDYIITVSNNGKPLPAEISPADVFVFGKSSDYGKNHLGIGGYEIRKLMRDFGGDAEIISDPSKEFPVAYKLIFHTKLSI